MTSSESLPLPMRKRGSRRGRCCRMVAATFRPAERASSASSARESSAADAAGPGDADEDGPFPALTRAGRAQAGQFLFQGGHQGREIQLEGAHLAGLNDGPSLRPSTGWGRRWAISMEPGWPAATSRAATASRRSRARSMKSSWLKEGGVQVGVDQAEALEAALNPPLPRQGRNHQALGVPHDDVGHRARRSTSTPTCRRSSAEISANCRAKSGVSSLGRRHLAAVEPLQGPVLMGF